MPERASSGFEHSRKFYMKLQRQFDQRGLTLLELLCVIAIIAILLGFVVGGVSKARSKATELKDDVEEGQKSIEKMQEPGGLLSPE